MFHRKQVHDDAETLFHGPASGRQPSRNARGPRLDTAAETVRRRPGGLHSDLAVAQVIDTAQIGQLFVRQNSSLVAQCAADFQPGVRSDLGGYLPCAYDTVEQGFAQLDPAAAEACSVFSIRNGFICCRLMVHLAMVVVRGEFSPATGGSRKSALPPWADTRAHKRRPARPGRSPA